MTHNQCLAWLYFHEDKSLTWIATQLVAKQVSPEVISSAMKAYYETV